MIENNILTPISHNILVIQHFMDKLESLFEILTRWKIFWGNLSTRSRLICSVHLLQFQLGEQSSWN